MATNTERIEQLQKALSELTTEVARLEVRTEASESAILARLVRVEEVVDKLLTELAEFRQVDGRQDERLKSLEKHADHPAALAAHDQRLRALEKGTDRLWQFAPLVVATFALLVSAYVAFVKK